jgi:osmotically-inducible protein OsmY
MDDVKLQQDVMTELEWDPSIEAAEIGVSVDDGIVTLNGRVHSYLDKWAAEKVASRVNGVKALANEIEVVLPNDAQHSDADLARAVADALWWNPLVPKNSIKVTVDNNWVTLDGNVRWQFQKDAAEKAVRNISGVRGLYSLISIMPSASVTAIQGKIQKALERRAHLDAKNIDVEVDGSKITLRGSVSAWVEREEANEVAWSAPGVLQVDNEISVSG